MDLGAQLDEGVRAGLDHEHVAVNVEEVQVVVDAHAHRGTA